MKHSSFPLWSVLLLITLGASLRVLRHVGVIDLPPNVAPVSALALFAAATLPRRFSWIIPIAIMIVSDSVIGGYHWQVMVSVYASFLGSLALGTWIRQRLGVQRILTATLAGSLLFFVVTNAAVWAFDGMYPHTWSGIAATFTAALPFFRNTVLGDLGYSALFFGLGALAMVYSRHTLARHKLVQHG
jgi:hypothetical protein